MLTKVKNNRAAFRVGATKERGNWFMVTANNAAGESPPAGVFETTAMTERGVS